MIIKKFLICLFCFITIESISAQFINPAPGEIFIDSEVPRIDITIEPIFLSQVFQNNYSYDEYPARFIFTSSSLVDTVENVGFRLRGNSSRQAEKKAFKISFNTFEAGRKFHGLEKMNINGDHNDPSVVRSKMCWDIYNEAGVPASRSNHVILYINNEYYGLYTNVEHIDEEFIKKRFPDNSGNLWKCLYPATLEYLGSNPDLYKEEDAGRRIYNLKTNTAEDNYEKLAHFIDVLNNYTGDELICELEKIFNIDNYLKVVALDVLSGNWDGHIPNKNNFYLYHDPCTDKINFINYDLDNTFGIDWFGINWAATNMYNWSSYGFGNGRPLYDRIIEVPAYRDRYSFYMREIMENYFNPESINIYLEEKLNLIQSYRIDDPFSGLDYGWSYQDFLDSYEEALGDHVKRGIKEYVQFRVATIQTQLEINNVVPLVRKVDIEWTEEEVVFNIDGHDDGSITAIKFFYTLDNINWIEENLVPDQDGDATYIHQVDTEGIMTYYVEITDDLGLSRNYPLCMDATERIGYAPTPGLVINEVMSSNESFKADEFDEYEDWIELFNATGTTLSTELFYLSDKEDNPTKWRLPRVTLYPHQYLVIWADDDSHQGDHHANFKLKKSGEYLGLFDSKENHHALIQELLLPDINTNESYARSPNGSGDFIFDTSPTYGFNNDLASRIENSKPIQFSISPNPSNNLITIDTDLSLEKFQISCVDSYGNNFPLKANGQTVAIKHLSSGTYFLLLNNGQVIHSKKFIIQK